MLLQTGARAVACGPLPRLARRTPTTNARGRTVAAAASNALLPPDTLRSARLLYASAGAYAHTYPGHAENLERVPAILKVLQGSGLTEDGRPGALVEVSDFGPAALADIEAVHPAQYVALLEKMSGRSAETGEAIVLESAPTYLTGSTSRDAFLAAGAVLALVDNVAAASRQREAEASSSSSSSSVPAAFAICRPPGHHCLPGQPMGFCIFGNAAIAARYAQRHHGLQRVLIYDFDVHHGNGTQDVFEDDPSVLFISSHQGGAYPYTGSVEEAGKGAGEGATINLPLPGLAGHGAALEAFDTVVAPAAQRFKPDIIIVSAGYDAHWRDPLGGLQFLSATYHALGARLKRLAEELCGGRLVFLLEGGYDLDALGESVANTFLGVLGEGPMDRFDASTLQEAPDEKVEAVLREARKIHSL